MWHCVKVYNTFNYELQKGKEEICKANYHKERRIKRGLFRSNTGVLINADINGSINIMRKYLKNISPNLEIAMDMGLEQRPLKKRVA